MKRLEILFFDGCPNVEAAARHAYEAIANSGVSADVHFVRIEGDADAAGRQFLGSPTIRVDGVDVEASARSRTEFGLQCRVYPIEGGFAGAPPIAWIEAALAARVPPEK